MINNAKSELVKPRRLLKKITLSIDLFFSIVLFIFYNVLYHDNIYMDEFTHGDPDYRIVLAKKIIQIFTSIKLKYDALQLNA